MNMYSSVMPCHYLRWIMDHDVLTVRKEVYISKKKKKKKKKEENKKEHDEKEEVLILYIRNLFQCKSKKERKKETKEVEWNNIYKFKYQNKKIIKSGISEGTVIILLLVSFSQSRQENGLVRLLFNSISCPFSFGDMWFVSK